MSGKTYLTGSQLSEGETADTMETDKLARLIVKKHEILVQLRDLARRQSDLICSGDMTRLLSLLSAKQHSLLELQAVEKELDPFRSQDPDERQWRSAELRQRVRQAATANETMLQEIMDVERDCESRLSRRRDDTAARLQGAHDKSSARNAYLQDSGTAARRIDLASES